MGPTKHQCAERVYPAHSFRSYPCSVPAKYQEAGSWWCGHHAPSKVAEKRRKQAEKARAEHAEWKAKNDARQAAHERARVCAEALAGVPYPGRLPELLKAVRVQVDEWKKYRNADPATVSFESVTEHLARIASATADVDAAYAALMGETP